MIIGTILAILFLSYCAVIYPTKAAKLV